MLGEKSQALDNSNDATIHLIYGVIYVIALFLHGKNLIWLWKSGSMWMGNASKFIHMFLALFSFGVMFGVPFAAISCFNGGKWIFGPRSCELRAAEAMFSGLCFLMTLYICCVDRYLMIKYESWYVGHGLKVMIPVMLCTCLSAAAVASLPLYGIGSYGTEPQGTSCLIDVSKHDRGTVLYILALTAFTFILPILISIFSLLGAHLGLSQQNKAAHKLKQMNKLVASLFVFATLGWTPFVYIYVSFIVHESIKYPLHVLYLGPICCKVAISILPIFYWVLLGSPTAGKSFNKSKIVYTKSGRAKKVE